MQFPQWKLVSFDNFSIVVYSFWVWFMIHDLSFGLDNRFTPNRRHAIVLTNKSPVQRRIYAVLDPEDPLRNNDVVITPKRRHFDVITFKWRRFVIIMTSLLRHVFRGSGDELIDNPWFSRVWVPDNVIPVSWQNALPSNLKYQQIGAQSPAWPHGDKWTVLDIYIALKNIICTMISVLITTLYYLE